MHQGKLFVVVFIAFALICIFCTSCNTTPDETLNTSDEPGSSKLMDTSKTIINSTSDMTSSFEPDIVETSIGFPWGDYTGYDYVLWGTSIGTIGNSRLYYVPINEKDTHRVLVDISGYMREFWPGPWGYLEAYAFNQFDVYVELPKVWEKTERITGDACVCFAEVTEADVFECFIGRWIYNYETSSKQQKMIDFILETGVFNWETNHRGASENGQEYMTGVLENGRDYMFFTNELDEFQIVQYDCYVQLNEEYLYSFTLVLKEADVDFVYDVMESVVIAESD